MLMKSQGCRCLRLLPGIESKLVVAWQLVVLGFLEHTRSMVTGTTQ